MNRLPPAARWPRSAWLLIAANLVPLWCVFALGWAADALLWLYWLENLVVGAFAALRIALARRPGLPLAARVALVPFFLVHFGAFCLAHGMFLAFIADQGVGDPLSDIASFQMLSGIPEAGWAVLALVLSHGYSFIANYLLRDEFRRADPRQEMLRPYARILVMQLTVLAGGALALFLQAPAAALAILTVLKTALDLAGHLRERAQRAAPLPAAATAE